MKLGIFVVALLAPLTFLFSENQKAPSYRNEILPILTRTGCNQGACHGKSAGQGQFKLSLRGYAAEQDHKWLTREYNSRRINRLAPEQSLLLLKATAQVPHEGKQRFKTDSRYFKTLAQWIAAGAPTTSEEDHTLQAIELTPKSAKLETGQTKTLKVQATFSDSSTRDISWLAQFFSGDETILKVTPEGQFTALRPGATTLRVHYLDQVAVATFSIPQKEEIQPNTYTKQFNFIDKPLFAKLKELHIPPSGHCDDATFLRRASLDATGTLPSPPKVQSFLADKSPNKREILVNELLASQEFIDYWTLQLGDLLQNRKERDHDVRGIKGVRSFHSWLRKQVATNKPWDQLTRDILTSKGSVHQNPAVGYYITTIGEKRTAEDSEVADSVAQAFLGTRIGCARCHNHPTARYTQDDFYHFAAYFTRSSLERHKPDVGTTTLHTTHPDATRIRLQMKKSRDKLAQAQRAKHSLPKDATEDQVKKAETDLKKAKDNLDRQQRELEKARQKPAMARHKRTGKMMAPQPLDRRETLIPEGKDPRHTLVNWLTSADNEYFSGAIVNRIWKHYMGAGLVEPVDDLRPSNPPSNPELWNALRKDFVDNGFDLRHLMRQILNSRAYQLQSQTLPGNKDDRRFYSHYLARRLDAEVLLDAISQSTGIPERFSGYPYGIRAIQLPGPETSSYFLTTFGRSNRVTACACERQSEVTLPQVLHIRNSDEIQSRLRNPKGRLKTILNEQSDLQKRSDAIFLATLSRPPRPAESQTLHKILKQPTATDNPEDPWYDLFWALLNTKEFAFNH